MEKLLKALAVVAVIAAVFLMALPTVLHKAGLHPDYAGAIVELPGKRALAITTSHSALAAPGETEGPATGVFGSEMSHPYYNFLEADMDVDVASIEGGDIPVDPQSFSFMVRTPKDERFQKDEIFQAKVKNSLKIDDLDMS